MATPDCSQMIDIVKAVLRLYAESPANKTTPHGFFRVWCALTPSYLSAVWWGAVGRARRRWSRRRGSGQ